MNKKSHISLLLTACPPRSLRVSGFTLLELLVVLSIAALLLTLVPLSFTGSLDLVTGKSAAHRLAATLRQARSLAVVRNQTVAVQLDARAGRYGIVGEAEALSLPVGSQLSFLDGRGDLERDRRSIRFFPDGSSSGGTVALDDGTRRFVIAVQWLLGRVSVTSEQAV